MILRRLLPLQAVLAVWLFAPAARADVVIAEFMAANDDTIEDEDGNASDWIELLNTGGAAENLSGWSLTDKASSPRQWIFPDVSLNPGGRLLVFASGENRRDPARELHTNFKLSENGEYLALVKPDGAIAHAYAPAYPPQITDVSYGLAQSTTAVTLSSETASVRYRLPPDGSLGLQWVATEYDDSAWTSAAQGLGFETTAGEFAPFVSSAGNLLGTMYGRKSSLFVRVPFQISSPGTVSSLLVKLRYDDGFVAWLNGVEVASNLAPETDPLPWNATATEERTDAQSIGWEEHTLTGGNLNLRTGANVLAIQLMNRASGNADALLQTSIQAAVTSPDLVSKVYFALPTPGAVNNAGAANPGPVFSAVTESAPQPAPGAPVTIPITAAVAPSVSPVVSVSLKYRTMYLTETSVNMRDDGVAPDASAGDGLYSASLTTTLQAGQMLRWRVVATDSAGTSATSPAFPDPLDSPQYWGTVATDPSLSESRLPVMHWFIPSGANPDTDAGARISLFYLGELYDNVSASLRGRSTKSFPKKGHNLDFNHDARFRWNADERRVKDVDLLTPWADKSHVRLTLAYEVCRLAGIPSHFAFPVRVQRNAAFHGVFDMVEDGDDRYLERAGLDPEGALYKFTTYNHLRAPVNGYEKKTRKGEPDTDLVNLVSDIAESRPLTDRRRYACDYLDLPAMINYHAVSTVIGHRDQGGKNFYVYRDTNRTQQWQFLPWDLDLTFGHTYTYSGSTSWGVSYSGQGYFDDDIDSQAIIQIGWDNPIKQILWDVPEFNQMFLRRVKTLTDQFIGPAAAPANYFPQRVAEILDLVDPPGTTSLTDAELDFRKWGFWVDGSSSSTTIAWTDSRAPLHRLRAQAARIISANPHPDYPGSAEYNLFFPVDNVPLPVRNLNTLPPWLPGRRDFLYTPNMPLSNGAGLPASQAPGVDTFEIAAVEVNPGAAGQGAEYFAIRNTGSQAVDLSGWKITGAVDFTLPGGCVIPAAGTAPVGVLYVAKEIAGFRSRTSSPRGGEFRLVVGGYSGQLSARGETIELRRPDNSVALSYTTAAQPTPLQQSLRISAMLYAPLPPTPAESSVAPGAADDDFEWIELLNTGATALDLSGARFVEGIDFVFPPATALQPGNRIIVAGNVAAFRARFGNDPVVAGAFTGNLDNDGEQIHLVDASGESVLEFRYHGGWSTAADELGHALIVKDAAGANWSAWDLPETWAPGLSVNGTPGQAAATGLSFLSWQTQQFNAAALADPDISGPLADPDKDGSGNLIEYLSGRPPLQPDAGWPGIVSLTGAAIQLDGPRNPLAVDAVLFFESSSALSENSWQTIVPSIVQTMPNGVLRVTFPVTQPRAFIRARVVLP